MVEFSAKRFWQDRTAKKCKPKPARHTLYLNKTHAPECPVDGSVAMKDHIWCTRPQAGANQHALGSQFERPQQWADHWIEQAGHSSPIGRRENDIPSWPGNTYHLFDRQCCLFQPGNDANG